MNKINFKCLTLVFILFFSKQVFAKSDLKNIVIIATGGTISGSGSSKVGAKYSASKIDIKEIVKTAPDVVNIANVRAEQLFQEASQNFNNDLLLKLANRVSEVLSQRAVDGVVITHGTDTMEETAYFLNLVIKTKKPIVIVGSMRPSTSLSADGPLNLYNAIALAASKQARNQGVLLVMNDKIFAARDVKKSHTTNVEGFSASNFAAVGEVYFGKPEIYYQTFKKHTNDSEFNIKKLPENLPNIAIVYAYLGFDEKIIEFLIENKVDGIVLAGVGDGNINKNSVESLKKASNAGILIVRSSRVGGGKVVKNVEINDDDFGFVVANNLTPQKARILAMIALTKTKNRAKIQEIFDSY